MSKRFTDTELWKLKWFCELEPAEKLAWLYIKDQCDSVGVWHINFRLGDFMIGATLDWERFREKCSGNIVKISPEKWWLVDFCTFQYPPLKEDSQSKPIISYIKQLQRQGLWETYKQNVKGMDTLCNRVQEKEKDKEKEKVKDKDGGQKKPAPGGMPIELRKQIITYLNFQCETKYRPEAAGAIALLNARYREGYIHFTDYKKVIDVKKKDWFKNDDFYMYLRPRTLFSTKFEDYLNQVPDQQGPPADEVPEELEGVTL